MTRTKSIKLRLTDEEHGKLQKLAGSGGISAFLRRRALGSDQREEQTKRLILLAELARMRNALVQIARDCEQQHLTDQAQLMVQLIVIERQLSKVKSA